MLCLLNKNIYISCATAASVDVDDDDDNADSCLQKENKNFLTNNNCTILLFITNLKFYSKAGTIWKAYGCCVCLERIS